MKPHSQSTLGSVALVGAGPGAADLLTVRALRAIEAADVVLFDALVGAEIVDLIPAHARRIAVGKRGHRASTPQDFINRLMVRLARQGARIVRLKGGDPSIFGRVAEERAFLESHGVAVTVIPGVTTASAAAAQFGFSLTERAAARRVLFTTGRTLNGATEDWDLAADAQTTVCLYMGCGDIAAIASRIIAQGRSADTPAVIVQSVERPEASLIACTLQDLANWAANLKGNGPVFIAIGEACRKMATPSRAKAVHAHQA